MDSDETLFQHIQTIRYSRSTITALRWTANGFFFFTRDGHCFNVRGQDVCEMLHLPDEQIFHSAWSSEGIHLAIAVRGAVEIHDVLDKKLVLTLPIRGMRAPSRVAWSLFDRYIAVAARAVRVFDTASGEEIACFPSHAAGIWGLSWSPNSDWIASGDEWGFVRLNELKTGNVIELTNAKAGCYGTPEWSPCGRFLVFPAGDEALQVFDLENNKVVTTLPGAVQFCSFNKIAFHPPFEGEGLLLTKRGGMTAFWSTDSWQRVASVSEKSSSYVNTEAAFNPLGHEVATLSEGDTAIQFWNISPKLAEVIAPVTFSPDDTAPVVAIPEPPQNPAIHKPSNSLKFLLEKVENASSNDAKGKSLEALLDALLTNIQGWHIAQRQRNGSEEFDLVISNRCEKKPHSDWGELLIVECKNREEKSGSPDIRALIGKMNARRARCKTAILVSWSGFTSGVDEVAVETRTSENLVVLLTGAEIRDAASNDNFGDIIAQKYWQALLY